MSENCGGCVIQGDDGREYVVPNIVINITFNDNRMNDDASTYIDNVMMDCGCNEGEEFPIEFELNQEE